MPRAQSVCSTPGCPELTSSGKCPEHKRAADQARGRRQARGYDRAHDRLRAHWQARLDSGEHIHCWRPDCKQRIDPHHWHLGHDDNDRGVHRGPECPACNLRAGGQASAHRQVRRSY